MKKWSFYNACNANWESHEVLFNLHSDSHLLVQCIQQYTLSMHAGINPYLPKQTYFINTHGEITDGLQLNGHGRMELTMSGEEKRWDGGRKDKLGDEWKMGWGCVCVKK